MVSHFFTCFTGLGSSRRGFIPFLKDVQPFNLPGLLEGRLIKSLFNKEAVSNLKVAGLMVQTEVFDIQFSDASGQVLPFLKNPEYKKLVYGMNPFVINPLEKRKRVASLPPLSFLFYGNQLIVISFLFLSAIISNHPP